MIKRRFKKMRKWGAFLISCLMLFSTVACDGTSSSGPGNSESLKEEQINNEVLGMEEHLHYTSDKKFLIYPYGGVPGKLRVYDKNGGVVEEAVDISDEQMLEYYQQIKDVGMNMTSGGYVNMTYSDYIRGLKFCEQVGITMMVYDANLVSVLNNTAISDGVAVDTILTQYEEMLASPAFAGISVDDEPTPAELSGFKTALKRWRMIETFVGRDLIFYINLFPSIAFRQESDGTFDEYIRKFVDEVDVDYVCYDHYVLKSGRDGNYLAKDFLYNLITAKLNSDGRRNFTVLQSIKYGGANRAIECAEDITFQMYGAIACGYEGFGWFCFWPPVPFDGATSFGEGAYDRQTNQPNETYYHMKAGINEVKKLEDVFFNFEWKGIKTVIGTENDNGGENEDFIISAAGEIEVPQIKNVKTTRDTLIGVFEGKDGNAGYMIVPFIEPSSKLENKVEIQFENCTKVAVWEDGVQVVYSAPNGKLVLNQKAGDGYFVVPIA